MATPFSYSTDTKIVRVPGSAKTALDKAKPPGIELWKFTTDVITIGLAVLEKLREDKNLEGLTQYQITDQLMDPISDLLAKRTKVK